MNDRDSREVIITGLTVLINQLKLGTIKPTTYSIEYIRREPPPFWLPHWKRVEVMTGKKMVLAFDYTPPLESETEEPWEVLIKG